MKARGVLLAGLTTMLAAGCGADGNEQAAKTVTVTVAKTVTASSPPPTTATPPPAEETPPEAPSKPLPRGLIAAEGTYAMKTNRSDYVGENITVEDEYPRESMWSFRTSCSGDDCEMVIRRELSSGGFKTITLHPTADRPNVFEGASAGTTGCATSATRPPTKQRYSVKLNSPRQADGRAVATKVDVYFTERTTGCPNTPARGIVSWRGTRQ